MLRCQACGKVYSGFRIRCECGGVLDLLSEKELSLNGLLRREFLDSRRYVKLLPISEELLPSIHLPITPIVRKSIGGLDLLFKLEYLMPSGSFKDRGTYVTMAKLKEEGIREFTLDSSGNAAISLALFARSEGLTVHIFIPSYTSEGKKRLLKLLGAEVHEVEGSRMEVHEKARSFEGGTYISHWYNPYFLEGTKLAAYEVWEEIGSVDYALSPVGSGSLFIGLYKGFNELAKLGKTSIPRMIAVQAKGYESLRERSVEKSELAEGIAITDPPRREEMKRILSQTGGVCVSVGDEEIERALLELIHMGFIVEPTSASVYAGFKVLANEGFFKEGSKVLLPLTGSGLKWVVKKT